jgi:hypothetical protein
MKALMLIYPVHYNINARVLYEREGTNDGIFFSGGQKMLLQSVIVKPATISLLRSELDKIGIKIQDDSTVKKVSNRFSEELSGINGGKIAVSKNGKEFYEIVEILNEEP